MIQEKRVDFAQIQNRLYTAFGALIFGLIAVILILLFIFFTQIVQKEQHRLGSVIASGIGDSINKVSFSGKYQTRLFIEDLVAKNKNIYAVIVQKTDGQVIAHSNPSANGTVISDIYFQKAVKATNSNGFLMQNSNVIQNGKKVEIIEIDMPYKKGYEESSEGVIRVMLVSDLMGNIMQNGLLYLVGALILISILSIFVVKYIVTRLGTPIKNLALQLQGILDYAPVFVYINDKNGNILSSSSLSGSSKKLIAQSILEKRQSEEKISHKVFKTAEGEQYNYISSNGDKNSYFRVIKSPIAKDKDGKVALVCTIALDVTEQKEHESKIELLLEEQTAFFKNAVAGIVHIRERKVVRSNEAWNRMFGYEDDEELNSKSTDTMHKTKEDYERFGRIAYSTMLNMGHFTIEEDMVKKDGSLITVLLSGAYLDKNDIGKGSIWVGVDITDRKKAENKLKDINESLGVMVESETKKRLEMEQISLQQHKMALMGEMIGAIAHQWRQPLNALGLTIQDIKIAHIYGELNEEYMTKTIGTAMERIQFMSKTIDDFKGFFSPKKEKDGFFIEDAIRATANIVSAQLDISGIELLYSMDNNTYFVGYKSELQQVLLNLISNAKDAILERKSEQKRISINVEKNNNAIVISVEDTGGGINDNIADRIFEPYYTTKEQGRGVGIGLYMSKQIIERHMDGELNFANKNLGAKFNIRLPVV